MESRHVPRRAPQADGLLGYHRPRESPQRKRHAQTCDASQKDSDWYATGVVARIQLCPGVWAGGGGRRRVLKLPSGFPSDAEQAQRRSSASFREDEIQGQELGFV